MQQQLSFKLTGYLMAPHEWLRIVAYKWIGKRYHYQLGDPRVVALEELTVTQKLFCWLLPFAVGMTIAFALALLWTLTFAWGQYPRKLPDYFLVVPLWHHLLHLTWIGLLFYTLLFSFNDLYFAYRLLKRKPSLQ